MKKLQASIAFRVAMFAAVTSITAGPTKAWAEDLRIESVTTRAQLIRGYNGVVMGSLGWLGGKLHHIGGESNYCGAHNEHYVYDPAADSWATGASMGHARLHFDAAWAGGKLYGIAGEYQCNRMTTSYSEAYDPATDTWTRIADLPIKLEMYAAGGVGDKVYVFGGHGGSPGDPRNSETYVYEHSSDSWTTGGSFSPAIGWLQWTTAVMGEEIYVISSSGSSFGPVHLYSYNTVDDSWTYRSQVPLPPNEGLTGHGGPNLLALQDHVGYLHWRELEGELGRQVHFYLYSPVENDWQVVDTSLLSFTHEDGALVDWPQAVADDTGCGFYLLGGQKAEGPRGVYSRHLQYVKLVPEPPVCPCDLFATSDFGPPMGKKKQLGSTLPVKFQLFFDDDDSATDPIEITSHEQLNEILGDCGPACPEIVIYDLGVTGDDLPDDPMGDWFGGGDEGVFFRYSEPNWIYNLQLDPYGFQKDHSYRAEVKIGENCTLTPGNDRFEVK